MNVQLRGHLLFSHFYREFRADKKIIFIIIYMLLLFQETCAGQDQVLTKMMQERRKNQNPEKKVGCMPLIITRAS